NEPEALELARGEDEDIRGLVVEWQGLVRNEPEESHLLAKPERFAERLELLPDRTDPADQQQGLRPVALQDRHRPDQEIETHPAFEVPHGQEQGPLSRKTEPRSHGGAVRRGAEPRRVRRAGDFDDPIPRNAIELP